MAKGRADGGGRGGGGEEGAGKEGAGRRGRGRRGRGRRGRGRRGRGKRGRGKMGWGKCGRMVFHVDVGRGRGGEGGAAIVHGPRQTATWSERFGTNECYYSLLQSTQNDPNKSAWVAARTTR